MWLRTSAPTSTDDLRLGDWWVDYDATPIVSYILTDDSPVTWTAVTTGAGVGHKIQDEGVTLSARDTLDFAGAGVTCADSGGTKTVCTIPGGAGSGYDTIEDEGTPLTQRTTIDFVGRISCSDFGGETRCVVPTTAPTHNLMDFTTHIDTLSSTPEDGLLIVGTSTGLGGGPGWGTLSGNTSTTKKYLTQTGTGAASAAPAWASIAAADVPTLNQNTTGTAAALTANGTNCAAGNYARGVDAAGNAEDCTAAGGGGGAPTNAEYWTGAADATLTQEKNLGALGTGLVVNTAGVPSIYAGSICTTPQFSRGMLADTTTSCSQPGFSEIAGTVSDAQVPDNITITLAATATALAANGANCAAGQAAAGVNASGAAEGCFAPTAAAHDLLSASHGDTITDTAVAGGIIVANASNLWEQLAVGSGGDVLTIAGGFPAWTAPAWSVAQGGTGLTAVGTAYSSLRTNGAANAMEWGPRHVVLASPVAVAVSASYVTVFTITPVASKTNSLRIQAFHAASATTIGVQWRVRSADTGNVGTCAFTHLGINATVSSSIDIFHAQIAIGAAPSDSASLASFSTAFNEVDINCAWTSDGTPGDVIVEAQLETGTTSVNVLAGSSYIYMFN